jgi:hypothetical protein
MRTEAMNHYVAEMNALISGLDDTWRGDEIFRKHIELIDLYGPRMTIEERVQLDGGFYSRIEPVKE